MMMMMVIMVIMVTIILIYNILESYCGEDYWNGAGEDFPKLWKVE